MIDLNNKNINNIKIIKIVNSMDAIDTIYNTMVNKLDTDKYPNISQLWINYLEKHTNLYKNILKEFNNFIESNKIELSKDNILRLYLILNNDIKN
jgi:hypothetical protein